MNQIDSCESQGPAPGVSPPLYSIVERKKECIRPGDVAYHHDTSFGVVTDVNYNDQEEVHIEWVNNKHRAGRTSIMFLVHIIRIHQLVSPDGTRLSIPEGTNVPDQNI
jgi:hypothetical protein